MAIIIGFLACLALLTRSFCFKGTSSAGISKPKSPLATIIPSATFIIPFMFSIASGFSILAIIGILCSECFSINFSNCLTSFFVLTNDKAIQSKLFSIANNASSLSFFVRAGKEILVFGRLTPFFDFNPPPWTTLTSTKSFLFVFKILKINFPSSTKTFSPSETSFGKSE